VIFNIVSSFGFRASDLVVFNEKTLIDCPLG